MQNLSSAARSPARPQAPQAAQSLPSRTLPSADLLQGGRSVDINHNGAVYRLQATKLGKLILTK